MDKRFPTSGNRQPQSRAVPARERSKREDMRFFHRIRVRFSEVDRQNVVFFANYLNYFDIALTEFCRARDIAALHPQGHEFHVVHASADYLEPLRCDEEIDIALRTERIGTSSVTFRAAIFGSCQHEVKTGGMIVWVLTDQATGRSSAIPDALREALAGDPDGTNADRANAGTRTYA